MDKKCFYAHSPQGLCKDYEQLDTHLLNVANLASNFSVSFGLKGLAELAGILHDIGKYQSSFQKRIMGEKLRIEHSICGAKEALDIIQASRENPTSVFDREILSYVISGHHSGLPDCGTLVDSEEMSSLLGRLKRDTEDYYDYKFDFPNLKIEYENWIGSKLNSYSDNEKPFVIAMFAKFLFSALVDADSLETEKFYSNTGRENKYSVFEELKTRLYNKFNSFAANESEINKKRTKIRTECEIKAKNDRGIFTLTVPTGGGKTLSSMAFALNHLIKHDLKRIIYVIPYTAIIEQTAKIFKEIFGEENVLEHHSSFTFEDDAAENNSLYLATENWDCPIVLTTNVQFFESLFSNKRGQCRKLHNIANSLIVFDEAQMLPIPFLKPCLKTIDILTRDFGCSSLLMSATCPSFAAHMCKGAATIEINENYKNDYASYKRTDANWIGKKSTQDLVDLIDYSSQSLIVVNSRKQAKELFDALPQNCNKYHLSTLMYPKHRKKVFEKIKNDLTSGIPLVVVSTALIECGVDFDFKAVFRSLAGIDSIVQASGRCNREGKRKNEIVYIFESDSDPQRGDIPIYKNLARGICENPEDGDILSIKSIEKYFEQLLTFKQNDTDQYKLLELFNFYKSYPRLSFNYATCNERFKYIDAVNKQDIIIIDDKTAQALLDDVKQKKATTNTFKMLNQYIVSVYNWEYESLLKQNVLYEIGEDNNKLITLSSDKKVYDGNVGLLLDGEYESWII